MSSADDRPGSTTRSIMPPHKVVADFLDAAAAEGLLVHAAERETAFKATKIGRAKRSRVDTDVRRSARTGDLGDFGPLLRDRLGALKAELVEALRVTPFETARYELELVAHGDGAFYKRHIDTLTAAKTRNLRVLSGVYYFHRRPKAFSGGELRLYAIGDPGRFVDIAPQHNALVVFPAWAPHEVRPVSCPSGDFLDSRFAINCWLYAPRPGRASEAGATV